MESSGSAEDARARAELGRELNANAIRELGLAVRNAELERNRWSAFTIVELEWISGVGEQTDDLGPSIASLPEQANAELERRARAGSDIGSEPDT